MDEILNQIEWLAQERKQNRFKCADKLQDEEFSSWLHKLHTEIENLKKEA